MLTFFYPQLCGLKFHHDQYSFLECAQECLNKFPTPTGLLTGAPYYRSSLYAGAPYYRSSLQELPAAASYYSTDLAVRAARDLGELRHDLVVRDAAVGHRRGGRAEQLAQHLAAVVVRSRDPRAAEPATVVRSRRSRSSRCARALARSTGLPNPPLFFGGRRHELRLGDF